MRPIDSAYDRNTAAHYIADPGAAEYSLIQDAGGPCSLIGDYDSLEAAVAAARDMDTDAAPTDLEDALDVDASAQGTAWLITQAEARGWRVVAAAPAGEYWTVLVAPDEA